MKNIICITGMNPMLLNAQLQALNPLLYGSQFHPGLLQVQQAAATAERLRAIASSSSGSSGSPGGPAERGSHRYSPYPLPSPPTSSTLSLGSPTSSSSSSAFQAVKKSNVDSSTLAPVVKHEDTPSSENIKHHMGSTSPMRATPPSMPPKKEEEGSIEDSGAKPEKMLTNEDQENGSSSTPLASDIKSMENLVNGLNGSSASKFGISHNNNDQQISAWYQNTTL